MRIFKRDAVLGALVMLLVWIGGYEFFSFIMAGSPATENYAWISTWWFMAYVLSKYDIKIEALLIVSVCTFFISFGAACFDLDWFYKDVTELSYLRSTLISLGYAFVISSPWLFNFAFTQGLVFFRKPA